MSSSVHGNTVVTAVTLATGEKWIQNSLLFAQRGHSARCAPKAFSNCLRSVPLRSWLPIDEGSAGCDTRVRLSVGMQGEGEGVGGGPRGPKERGPLLLWSSIPIHLVLQVWPFSLLPKRPTKKRKRVTGALRYVRERRSVLID